MGFLQLGMLMADLGTSAPLSASGGNQGTSYIKEYIADLKVKQFGFCYISYFINFK